MIPENEFREKARTYEVPITTIERDYAQNWLLKYLPDMAFKGGTGLRKAYIRNYRFSDDLDFTLLEHITIDELKYQIQNAVHTARAESGINFLNEINSEEVVNGYVFTVYFRILRKTGDPLKIKLDITKKENEIIVNPLQQKKIIHAYSDKLDTKLTVYSIEEIFAEKIRSLFQRTRPRDLYDIWYLSKNTKSDTAFLMKKCEYKNVTLDFKKLIERKIKFEKAWKNSLQHQLKNLPEVDKVFATVITFLKKEI